MLNKSLKKRVGELERDKVRLEEERSVLEKRVRELQESCNTMKVAKAIAGKGKPKCKFQS